MLGYIGGKNRIGRWIKDYIPTDIKTYVEPFGGMFWVYFNLNLDKYPDTEFIYNDTNVMNYNLFKCVMESPETLFEMMSELPNQELGNSNTDPEVKKLFNKFQKEIFADDYVIDDSFKVATKYAYVLSQIFIGNQPPSIAPYMDLKGKYPSRFLRNTDKMDNPEWIAKFNRIIDVHNLDYKQVIELYDAEDSFFYLDPPYYTTEKYYANHKFNKESHNELANIIKNIKGKFALSYYEFDGLEELFPKDKFNWKYKEYKKLSGSRASKAGKSIEVLIMNY